MSCGWEEGKAGIATEKTGEECQLGTLNRRQCTKYERVTVDLGGRVL